MREVTDFKDYELIDATCGERLERWGDILLIRPDPQIIWRDSPRSKLWGEAHARYVRSSSGGGHWERRKKVPEVWSIGWNNLTFNLKPMGFKHTGIFPEQAVNWRLMSDIICSADRPLKVLNLFGYTGAATLACAEAGASVTHVDAAKGMVLWAKDNARASGLAERPIRWLVDDCVKFVQREIRRGNTYDGIVMDPPSYGRGPSGEVWRLEEQLYDLLSLCDRLLSDDAQFLVLNSYTTGLSPTIMRYMLSTVIGRRRGGRVECDEIGLPITELSVSLPCGNTAIWTK